MAEETGQPEMADSWASTFAQARSELGTGSRKTPKGKKQADPVVDGPDLKEVEKVLDKLMEPKYWKGLVRAPADFMLMRTGHAHWNMSDSEAETLAVTGSLTARAFMPTMDPKYLCLILFLSNCSFIYGTRLIEELRISKMEAQERMEFNAHKSNN